jgi:hypothetical protein
MGNRPLSQALISLFVAGVVISGCNSGNTIPQHSPDDQKAIDKINAMTPQERIDLIQKGPMPPAAKESMIKKIKEENHLN